MRCITRPAPAPRSAPLWLGVLLILYILTSHIFETKCILFYLKLNKIDSPAVVVGAMQPLSSVQGWNSFVSCDSCDEVNMPILS